jgi:hypothetical protein
VRVLDLIEASGFSTTLDSHINIYHHQSLLTTMTETPYNTQ